MKKKPTAPIPEKTVISGIETTFGGRLEKLLTAAFAKGYTFICPPVFAGNRIPSGLDPDGDNYHPHFLIVLQKLPSTPSL